MADAIPTSAVKIADTAIPTRIKPKDDNAPRIAANLKVREVVSSAPIVPQAIAPIVPTCTRPVLIARTAPKDAPAAVPKIAGSATALLQAPWANKPATANAAPTITAAVTRGNLISHRISLLPGLINADQKLSICVAPRYKEPTKVAIKRTAGSHFFMAQPWLGLWQEHQLMTEFLVQRTATMNHQHR